MNNKAIRFDFIRGLNLKSYFFILPLLFFIFAFIFLPILGTFITSFTRDIIFLEKKFVLLENYKSLINDKAFWQSLRFTMFFIFVSVPIEIVLGIFFAVLINQKIPIRGFVY